MKKYILFSTAVLLSACVSSPDYNEALNSWIGTSEESLEVSWGSPASVTYLAPNQELLTYVQLSPVGEEFCRTTFTITNGIVNDFAFEGSPCSLPPY